MLLICKTNQWFRLFNSCVIFYHLWQRFFAISGLPPRRSPRLIFEGTWTMWHGLVYRGQHIRLWILASGWMTLECNIWFRLRHIRVKHFTLSNSVLILKLTRESVSTLDKPLQSNVSQPKPNVTLYCVSTQNQCSQSNVQPPIRLRPQGQVFLHWNYTNQPFAT